MKISKKPYLERSILKLTNSGAVLYDLVSKRHAICNKDLAEILAKCDGTKTIREIANIIGNKDAILEKTLNIIEKLNKKELVRYARKNEKSRLRIISENISNYSLDSVFFEATKRCNLNCVHCYNPQSKTRELQEEEIFEFISEIEKLGALKMRITGGEPFMKNNLFNILRKIYSSMIDFSIFTNGTLIEKEQIKELSLLNPEFVAVSIDSVNSKEYRKIRKKDNKKVLNNLEEMLKQGIRTRANIVLFKGINDSYDSIKNTLSYLKELGMDKDDISFDEVVPEGRGVQIPLYNSEEKIKIMKKISRLYEGVFEKKLLIKTPEGQKRKIDSYCGLGENFFYIGSEGSISLCPMLNFGEYVLGNVKKESLRSIWEKSPLLNYFRKKEHIRDSDCEDCKVLDICAGGCKAKSLFFNGSINSSDPWMCSYFFRD
jgi:radical SAM protein with 4Fe4S-binding SPASM domain